MTAIHGKDSLLEMKVAGIYYPVLCGTDLSFDYLPEFITKTGPNSPSREFAVRIEEFGASVSGLTFIDNGVSLSFFYMLQNAVRRISHDFRVTFEDADGNDKQIAFTAFIGRSTITGPSTDFCNASIEFKVTGGITIGDVDLSTGDTINTSSDWWTTTPDQNYLEGGSISQEHSYILDEGMQILAVFREGLEYDPIEVGSPGNRQYKHDTTTGYLYFRDNFNTGETVFIIFKNV